MSESVARKALQKETSRRSRLRDKGAVCFEFDNRQGERQRARVARDIDPSHSDAITSSEPDGRTYADPIPELPLPGSGERLEDCGDDLPRWFCEHCGAPTYVGRTCRRSRCPRCWQSWGFKYGKSMASKLEALGRHEFTQNKKKVKQHHLTVSFRDSTRFNSDEPLERAIEAVKPLLQRVGVDTGYIIPHNYRIAPEYRGDVLGHESGDGDMTWKDVLAKVEGDAWTWDAVRDEFLVYAPHFHVVCLSEFVDTTGVGEIEDETGVVIHRITTEREDGKTRSIANTEELCKVVSYSLSHSALALADDGEEFRSTVRPFGKVANFKAWGSTDEPGTPVYDVDEAMRAVAPTVLGVEFSESDSTCSERIADASDSDALEGLPSAVRSFPSESEHGSDAFSTRVSETAATWDAVNDGFVNDDRGAWDATEGCVPPDVSHTPSSETERCGGELKDIWDVPVYLGDLEWLNMVEERFGEERLVGLKNAFKEWEDMGCSRPELPPDVVDPPD